MHNKIILKPGQRIRTLGLYQPFAGLMLHGKIETRMVIIDRKPPFPFGKYLIYATKKEYHPSDVKHIAGRYYNSVVEIQRKDPETFKILGMGICVGDLVEIIDPVERWNQKTFVDLPAIEYDVHNWPERRRVGLVFQNVERIKPFEIKGKQGIGFLSDAEVDKIEIIAA